MIELLYGTMKSGKSKAIFDIVDKIQYTGKEYEIFKSSVDTRTGELFSRRYDYRLPIVNVTNPAQMLEHDKDIYIVDEIQFMDDSLVNVVSELAENGKTIILAGLYSDIKGEPFNTTAKILNIADKATRLEAICEHEKCSEFAVYNRLVKDGEIYIPKGSNIIVDDGSVDYKVFCRYHGGIDGTR